jgi:DNA repair ATPase RecN
MDSPSVKVLKETSNFVSMEVVLADAAAASPRRRHDTPDKASQITADDIERKLESAAERRRSFNLDRQQSVAAKMAKIEEVHAKKNEMHDKFVQSTKEALEQKLEAVGEKREAYLNQLKEKVKEHLEKLQVCA